MEPRPDPRALQPEMMAWARRWTAAARARKFDHLPGAVGGTATMGVYRPEGADPAALGTVASVLAGGGPLQTAALAWYSYRAEGRGAIAMEPPPGDPREGINVWYVPAGSLGGPPFVDDPGVAVLRQFIADYEPAGELVVFVAGEPGQAMVLVPDPGPEAAAAMLEGAGLAPPDAP